MSSERNFFLDLNEDCLRCIFDYLNVLDLVRMEKVCRRFQALAKSIYPKIDEVDFDELSQTAFIPLTDASDVVKRVGKHISSLIASKTNFLSNSEILPRSVLTQCKKLQEVQLTGFKIITPASLKRLSVTIKEAKVVRLNSCVFNDDIKSCLVEATQMEVLELTGNANVQGSCLIGVRGIKEIDLSHCDFIEADFFVRFCKANRKLRSVGIIGLRLLEEYAMNTLVETLKDLECLSINDHYNDHDDPQFEFEKLAQLPKLTKIRVQYGAGYTDEDNLREFYPLMYNRLESLILEDIEFDSTLQEIGKFTKLKELGLYNAGNCKDSTLAMLSCTQTLQELSLIKCVNITPQGLLEVIKNCQALESINISECPQYTDDFLIALEPHLIGRPHPLELIVSNTPIHKDIEGKGPKCDFIKTFVKNNRNRIQLSYIRKSFSEELWFIRQYCTRRFR
ncbi:uncharacterized protein LOC129788748 [Lutzomyia longipalpis]|uniref:uncharacterized protein LOC129788748 n=1 Tax=Lutzomyia longipalpis TaxID=7200 RepID=UPI0024846A09|nr:uncharacterized protein LOC129788748 [Lutzomyia longipalpis]